MGQPLAIPVGTYKKTGSINPLDCWQLMRSPRGNHFSGLVETQNYVIAVEDDHGMVPLPEVAWCLANGWK